MDIVQLVLRLFPHTGDEAATIEDYYEPYLMRLGMIERTPKGRVATELARKHLGKA